MSDEDSVISVEGLSYSFGRISVLEDASFQIKKGEFVGVIGPNGGGKTTLFKLLLGLYSPQNGVVHVFGSSPRKMRHRIAYVPQSLACDSLFPISLWEVVLSGTLSSSSSWWGGYSNEEKEKASKVTELLGISHLHERSFGGLSGGEARKALIARALVSDPELLLLDEPTAGVDPKAQQEIYSLLKSLRGKITMMMVTHDLHAVIDNFERLLCIQKGVLSLQPEQVCEHFAIGLYHAPLAPKEGEK